jgi:diguanylate cyclase (GGDEF)-like protein
VPPRLRLLVTVVYATGLVALGAVALLGGRAAVPEPWQVLLAMVAFGICDIPLLHIRFGTHRYSFTWSELAVIIGLVLLPPVWLVPLAALAVLGAHTLARLSAVKSFFNALSCAAGVGAAYAVMAATGGPVEGRLQEPSAWLQLMLGTIAYAVWNALTVNGAVALSQNVPFRTVMTKGLLLKALVLAGNTLCATVIVVMAALQPATLFLVPLLLGLLYFVYGNYLRAMQERDTWQVLQATSRELLRTERSEVAQIVLEQTGALLHAEFVELLLVARPDAEPPGAASVFRRTVEGEVVHLEAPVHDVAGSFWGRAACELEPFEIRHQSAVASQQRDLDAHGLQLCIVAPLLVQDQCLGTLRIGFAGEAKLNKRDRQVFTTFANHVAGAVHNTRLFAEVRSKALQDPLTGLPNRALLADRLAHAQARARRGPGAVAVLFLDLDRFKVVNDSLGHSVGDRLLVAVADRLTACIRPGDTAGRFGGDEFIVVCDVHDEAEALRLAQRLVTSLKEPFVLGDSTEPIFLSASVGVAMGTDGHEDAATMIRDADAAMYRAKERGRSRCELFDHDMRERAVARLETENDLRRALERGELRLDYQAFVDVDTQAVIGAEALVRWNHPRRGELSPEHFIGLAEETGLIRPLGSWVLHEACAQLARWCRNEDWPKDFLLSVNLSPHQLSDPALLDDVTAALATTGVDPEMLCLEITESALVADMEAAMEVLERLRAIGVRIALDDFGTGYSSFSYLHRLPVDVLKIDRSFTTRLTLEPRDRAVVAGMISMAHALGLQTVAEGVETAGQLAELGSMRCNLAQGYYLSAPREAAHVSSSVLAGSLRVAP